MSGSRTVRAAWLAGTLALAVGAYAIAGYWLAPRYLAGALEKRAQAAGLELRSAGLRTDPFRLRLEIAAPELRGRDGQVLASAKALRGNLGWASLWRGRWEVQLEVNDGRVRFVDRSRNAPAEIAIDSIALKVAGLSTSGAEPAQYELHARMAGRELTSKGQLSLKTQSASGSLEARDKAGGTVRAQGTLGAGPFAADLQLDVAGVALAQAQSWLPADAQVKIASGTLAGKGRLRLAAANPGGEPLLYEGSLSVHGLEALDARTGKPLLGWEALQAPQARLTAHSFDAGEVIAKAPSAHLVLGEDGKLNFARAFGRGNDPGRPGFRAAVTRLRVEAGRLEFEDRSFDNPLSVAVDALEGSVAGFDTAPGDTARVELRGRVDRYGLARITGTLNVGAPQSLTDIRASLRNLDLAKLSPYAAKFAGYRIEEGRLYATLRYRVSGGRIVGDNRLAIEGLRLGEKVERIGVRDLPIELAVALLTDPQGRIDVAIPVRGDLADPKFDVGTLIRDAIGSVVRKLVSAPFRFLSAAFGGEAEDLGALRFEPGSVEVTPPMQEALEKLTRLLSERPALQVDIHGGYDREADAAAVRRHELRREIAQRAGIKLKGNEAPPPLDLSNAPTLHAAESLFLERGGNRAELEKLRALGPRYGRALLEWLAASIPFDSSTTEALGRARAYTVQAELALRGIDAGRLRVSSPSDQPADVSGVPTTLDISS
jgi:hypothetical protein